MAEDRRRDVAEALSCKNWPLAQFYLDETRSHLRCHKAADKPHLRPRTPEQPEAKIVTTSLA